MKITRNMVKENIVFHCDTEKKANELLKKLDKLGYKWAIDDSYLDKNHYDIYKEDTCYRPYYGTYGNVDFFTNKYVIINYELDQEERSKNNKVIDDFIEAEEKYIDSRLMVGIMVRSISKELGYNYLNIVDWKIQDDTVKVYTRNNGAHTFSTRYLKNENWYEKYEKEETEYTRLNKKFHILEGKF